MKAFKFKLHAILALKHLAKNEALQAYTAALQKRQALELEIDSYNEKRYALEKNIDKERESLSIAHKNAYYIEVLEHEKLKILCATEKLRDLKQAEKAALQEYLQAKQEEEMIKKMKVKLKAKHAQEAHLSEAKELEESINQRVTLF